MTEHLDEIKEHLESIALKVVMLEPDDIPTMGEIINIIDKIYKIAKFVDDNPLIKTVTGFKSYLERLILNEENDVTPLEEAVTTLQEIHRARSAGKPYDQDISPLLGRLGFEDNPPIDNPPAATVEETETPVSDQSAGKSKGTVRTISTDEISILGDFVVEAQENLETIEINLIDLEQDPQNADTMNAIFRPFHTIKGVSGFLNLNKINELSHSTENLLDSARQGEFIINNEIADTILDAVDTLNQLIETISQGLGNGVIDDHHIDVKGLIKRIEIVGLRAKTDKPKPIGEILVEKGKISESDLDDELKEQEKNPQKRIGEILVARQKIKPEDLSAALKAQTKGRSKTNLQVKVDTAKLDNLVDLTGELVIAQSMLKENSALVSASDQKLNQNLNQLTQIVSGIQKIAMSMRMVPINNTFQKMVRLVRDLAKHSRKEVVLKMSGEETEIDRNVVEELYEPMVHMIRNSLDHGLERPEEREAAGKNRTGRVYLRAYHKGGNIIIEIEDDGRGLSKERIFEKAVSSNLISRDANLSDSEIYDLIFQPGFSTAQEITDVSGRGVGMDVVRKRIEKLRGRLDIHTEWGKGSTFVIHLPLTLAIIEGMLVRVGLERYIIPTLAILESFKAKSNDYHTVEGKGELVSVRGSLIPLIRLSGIFNTASDSENVFDGLIVVVENKETRRALLIDELLGKEEFVIKALGAALRGIKGLAGGAILGNGQVGLILDMAGLFEIANQ